MFQQDVDHVSEAPGLRRRADGRQTGDGSVGDRRHSGEEAGAAGLRQGGQNTRKHTEIHKTKQVFITEDEDREHLHNLLFMCFQTDMVLGQFLCIVHVF